MKKKGGVTDKEVAKMGKKIEKSGKKIVKHEKAEMKGNSCKGMSSCKGMAKKGKY